MRIISFDYDPCFQCYYIEHLECTTTDHALPPFYLEWFLVSQLQQVAACKNKNPTKPLHLPWHATAMKCNSSANQQ
ncbi:uncharacterized protein J3R85_016404 [Psidium guajava]|nr:uncharacterized protein J3R85_016404 [Psidium guajava]